MAAEGGHQLVGLGLNQLSESLPKGVNYVRYSIKRGNPPDLHEWLVDLDSKLIRGEACAKAGLKLKTQGFEPDLICAHPGWGEALFLKEIWPDTPMLCYQEFFYNSRGFDYDFDPELQGIPDWKACARTRLKNTNPLLALDASDWNVTPTQFQRSTFPTTWQKKITVIHDGIDTSLASPDNSAEQVKISETLTIQPGDPTITFVNRRLEPYRGCHTFIRSIPELQRLNPQSHIIIVGATKGVSYGGRAPNDSWKDVFMEEIKDAYNPEYVHFLGNLEYKKFLSVLRISACHVYLTYPFVLSWSLLEAMSLGLPIVGSDTAPVHEVIRHMDNGLLIDFFSPKALAEAVTRLLNNQSLAKKLGNEARKDAISKFSLKACLPRQRALMELVAAKDLSAATVL
ncbi:glycosyltransferase [Prochlorococcus marinus]|uniref:glycosyltransferase n=1 Tax=Prochlorococcus marinus TaxID=1219 RepID=UPI001F2BA55D|nr:glycosyltransferase [Prochlorococcus marinus]